VLRFSELKKMIHFPPVQAMEIPRRAASPGLVCDLLNLLL
jgi:hypothetical protein